MGNSNVNIRPLSVDDLDVIAGLKGEIIRQPHFNPEVEKRIYKWELCDNPFRRDDQPIGFVLEDGEKIVGSVVLVPGEFKIGDETVYGCFEVDLMVLPEYRFHGIKLLNATWKDNRFPVVVSTTLNEVSYALEKKLGVKDVVHTKKKHIKMTSISKGLTIRNLTLKNFLLYAGGLRGMFSGKTAPGADLNIEKMDRFGDDYDDLFNRVALGYKTMQIRGSEYLNWRYVDFPYGERSIFSASDKDGLLRGFIVLQKEQQKEGVKKGNVLDLFCVRGDKDALRSLLLAAGKYAKEEKLGRIEILSPSQEIAAGLSDGGYTAKEMDFPACLYQCSGDKLIDMSSDMNGWFITAGDGDTAVYSSLSWNREFERD